MDQLLSMQETLLHRRFSIAPMMGWSHRHGRMFWRQLTPHALLYTEMVTTGALLNGPIKPLLSFHKDEHPIALQLGGSTPKALAACAQIAETWGYDEVNLNCGCPSPRVQRGQFGACLMAEPTLVADCVIAMRASCTLPITVKHRIGVDHHDSYDALCAFVARVADAGCHTFIIHARKAWLQGLSPKDNRHLPPLDYPRVYQLKRDFPHLTIIINGGITNLNSCQQHWQHVDGVMLGRAACNNPYLLHHIEQSLRALHPTESNPLKSREQILQNFMHYMKASLALGVPLGRMVRPVLGLFQGLPGARLFRRHISEFAYKPNAGIDVIQQAYELLLHTKQLTAFS